MEQNNAIPNPNSSCFQRERQWIIALEVFGIVVFISGAVVGMVCGFGICDGGESSPEPPPAPMTASSPTTTVDFPADPPVPLPVLSPLRPPTPLSSPSPPTTTGSRADSITTFIKSITLSGQILRFPSSATAEEQALQWLIYDDSATNESNQLALQQRYALSTLRFQNRTGSADATFATWTADSNECDWFFIVCDEAGRVITLNLYDKSVQGRIPEDFGLLSNLSYLDLYNNALTGTVPTTLRSLTALSVVNFSKNSLTGTIPSSLSSWTDLTQVYMYANGLMGTVPFCSSNLELSFLIVDCSEVNCPCCTHCCPTPEVGVPVYC